MKPLEKKHRNDLILIAVLLAAAGIAFGTIQLSGKRAAGTLWLSRTAKRWRHTR